MLCLWSAIARIGGNSKGASAGRRLKFLLPHFPSFWEVLCLESDFGHVRAQPLKPALIQVVDSVVTTPIAPLRCFSDHIEPKGHVLECHHPQKINK